jgi:GT2 family glycosyltransferase
LMYALDNDVGAVGAKLRFADGRLQHVGVVCHDGGRPSHPYYRYPAGHPGYFSSAVLPADLLAVTGACLLVDRRAFEEVGGLSPGFPVNFNDIDFCLKLHASGRRNVYSSGAELHHYESSTRPPQVHPGELEALQARWLSVMRHDPYYNPNLLQHSANYLLPVAG